MALPRITAPLPGLVTTGSWNSFDITIPGVTLPNPAGRSPHFEMLLPAQYDSTKIYPIVVWLHPDFANQWYSNKQGGLSGVDADGFYNNVTFRTNRPAICIVPYADQTSGNDAVDNWGGWQNNGTTGSGTHASGDTGPNTFMVIGIVKWATLGGGGGISGDASRVYIEGFSLGGHGVEYMMLKYNQVNGSQKIFTAGMAIAGSPEINYPTLSPSTSDYTAMQNVPVWFVSGGQDTTSPPSVWNDKLYSNFAAGSTNYPAPGGTLAQARAGTSNYHYWRDPNIGHQQTDSSGNPYPIYSVILDFLFAQVGGLVVGAESADKTLFGDTLSQITDAAGNVWQLVTSTSLGLQITQNAVLDNSTNNVALLGYFNHVVFQENTAGNWYQFIGGAWSGTTDPRGIVSSGTKFSVTGGKIFYPDNTEFIGRGMNIYDGDQGNVSTSSAGKPLLTLFPQLSLIRLVSFSYNLAPYFDTFVNTMTGKGIVVLIEHHSGAGGGVPPLTGQALTDENDWFKSIATSYKDNPYVWFGTLNEPGGPGTTLAVGTAVTAEQVSNYNTIRNAGNPHIVVFQVYGSYPDGLHYTVGSGNGLTPDSAYAMMTNVVFDFHFYNGLPHFNAGDGSGSYSTSQSFLNSLVATYITETKTIKTADGDPGVIIGEYGIATDGNNVDPGGTQTCIAAQQSGYGSAAWNWASGASSDNLTNGSNQLTTYGTQVAGWINAGPGPHLASSGPPSANNTTVLAGSGALITDLAGNLWGINGSAQVTKNSVADTTTANVVEIAYVSNVVWQKNTAANWYSYNGSTWDGPFTTSPLPNPSPSGTVILVGQGGSIIDASLRTWTISGIGATSRVTLNGTLDTSKGGIIEMAYVNGQVWTEDSTLTWYPTLGLGQYGTGTTTSPLNPVPGGLFYIAPFKAAGMRVITYLKQQSPSGFITGLANLRAEQAANHDIFAYEGCQEPDTAVITGTPETLASAAAFQQNVWAAGLSDGLPVIQTSFGVLADYGTSGNLAAFATYANAHTYPGNVPGNAGTAPGFMTALNADALLTTPAKGVAHTEFGWANDHNAQLAIASYVLNFAMSSFFDFNNPYCIVNGLYDDATGQWGLFNNDQTPRLAATALDNLFTLLQDNGTSPLGFGPGKLNVSFSGLPASPSGVHMGGQSGVLQKSDGSFWIMLRNEQTLTGPDPNHTAIVVAPVSVVMTLGTLATSIAVFDSLIGTTAVQNAANTSSLTVSLPAHPILIKIVRP